MELSKFRKQIKSSNGKSRCYLVWNQDGKFFKDVKNLRSKGFDVEKMTEELFNTNAEIQKVLKE